MNDTNSVTCIPKLPRRARSGLVTALLCVLCALCGTQHAVGNEVWLNGIDPVTARIHNWPDAASRDYYQLFQPNAPWTHAASHVTAFLVTTPFLLLTPDEILAHAFADLKRRNIGLAVETTFLSNEQGCGKGVEAFAAAGAAEKLARRVAKLGGELRYIAMSEVLWFGHQFNGQNACHLPIPEIARQVAVGVAAMKQIFPSVEIGSIEVIGQPQPADWVDQITQWTQAYHIAVGKPLDFVHVDIDWFGTWREQLMELARQVHAAHIPFGVIYNGFESDQTGVAWTRQAEEHFVMVESGLGVVPEHAILQTWMPQPVHMLPETDPGAMTYLVNRYIASPTRIALQRTGASIAGRLTDGAGNSIGQATVRVLAVANAKTIIMAVRKLTGLVPPGAATAVIGVRINVECGCSGPANVAIGRVVYHDDRSGQTVQRQFTQAGGAIANVARFVAAAGQKMWQNTPGFLVTPGDPFTIEVPMSASYDSAGNGVVAIIFLDHKGQGISRVWLPFEPSTDPVRTTVTDALGRFSLPLAPALSNSNPSFLATFDGNDQFRLSSSMAP
jgi:hypothetical protein